MHIPDWISTNVLNFETESSRAYISNLITFELFWLQKESSDLWKILYTYKDIKKLQKYAEKRNLGDELFDFLKELQAHGLIVLKDTDTAETKKVIGRNFSDVKNKQSFLDKWNQLNAKEKKLTRIQFELSYKCNEKCIHCLNDKDMNDLQIRFEDIKPIIDDGYELGVTQIVLSGGECTISDDFLKIAKYIRKKRIELVFFTNGQKLHDNPAFFEEVVKLYPFNVGLSLYSMRSEIHDKITGVNGSQQKTLKVIEKLLKYNIPVEIKCFLTKYNADYFEEVIKYAQEHNCRYSLDESLIPNKNMDNLYTEISENQLEALYKYLYEHKMQKFVNIPDEKFLNEFPCMSGRTTLDIDPLLNVTSCPTADFKFANLHNISLKELWLSDNQNNPLNKWKTLRRKDFTGCFTKEYCKYCSFCPGKYTQDYTKHNLLCSKAKLKMKIIKDYEPRL